MAKGKRAFASANKYLSSASSGVAKARFKPIFAVG
jgi:hypothetical protein